MAYVFETLVGQGDDKMTTKKTGFSIRSFLLSEVKLPEMFGAVVIGGG